ncbi:hypothetical protein CK203_064708 [Vitis vinifera]|uniref:C-JID domain-containing protein n=1 Tax=Vitis vinifera TaxID=29760 RepID=A0A438G7B4_VITVI|nr:hypothetical protein CK203_064708 [Vitis vinifera]
MLPQNWYQDNMFLGFSIGCAYVLLDNESDREGDDLRDLEHFPFPFDCECYEDDEDGVSDQMWVMYYPKVAIPENFHSNQWTALQASIEGYNRYGKPLKVKYCVIDLIYDLAHQNRDLAGTFRDHGYSCSDCQLDTECELKLCLAGNEFYELPTIECPLALDSLCLRNCEKLESLPSDISLQVARELGSLRSLEELYATHSYSIGSVAFFISIAIPRSSGIPEWIRYQKEGSKLQTKLPRNWYKNDDFLGFALFSIHVPLDYESDDLFDNQDTWSSELILNEDEIDNQETPSSEPDIMNLRMALK